MARSRTAMRSYPRDVAAPAAPASARVLTIPNVISVARLLCVPVFLWLLFVADDQVAAAVLLGVLGVTDFVDGWIARRFNQVSALGQVLDPVADRTVLIVGVGGIIVAGGAPWGVSLLVVLREVLVAAMMVVGTAFGMKRFAVTWWGKAGTFCLFCAFPLFLGGSAGSGGWYSFVTFAAWCFAIPGLLMHWYSGISYVPLVRDALREGRKARSR
jgi:cardiolipin synthase (CMP-forming)